MTVSITFGVALIDSSPQFPVLSMLCIGALATIGLIKKPTERFYQVAYTLTEFGLISIPHFVGEHVPTFQLLGILLVLRSAEMFNWRGRLVVASSVYLLFITVVFTGGSSLASSINHLTNVLAVTNSISLTPSNILILQCLISFYYGLLLAFMLLLVSALMSVKQSRNQLASALSQLRQYSLQIEDQATLQERNRIAREIHDTLGHTLTAQSIQLDSGLFLLNTAKTEQASSFFNMSKSLCAQALQEVRQSVSLLRSDCLLEASLESAIAALIQELKTTTTIIPTLTINLQQSLPSELSLVVYRIIQAAVTNIVRHSEATTASLQLTTHSQTLYLIIQDNGKGFDPTQNSTGFGLQGMQERTAAINGQFNLVSEPGAGCLITIQIPLVRPQP
ncbi:MAG: sensor histidine kinase [Cyanobacteria bacterium J06573_11]